MSNLDDEFHLEMIQIYHLAKKHCNYNATRFFQMVNDNGGLATAKILLSSQEPQAGLTKLWDCDRLDLSVEALVINPRFSLLFSEKEGKDARARLVSYGWEV